MILRHLQLLLFQKSRCNAYQLLRRRCRGKTVLQQNPYPPHSLAWATWIIARLGGWSGYQSQKPPGIMTLIRGLKQFESTFFGWKTRSGSTCVYTVGSLLGETKRTVSL